MNEIYLSGSAQSKAAQSNTSRSVFSSSCCFIVVFLFTEVFTQALTRQQVRWRRPPPPRSYRRYLFLSGGGNGQGRRSLYGRHLRNQKFKTSTPVIRTGVYPHMPIAQGCIASGGQPDAASSPASLSHLACDCPVHFTFWPWGRAIPRAKFTKMGDDLLPTHAYHPAKYHRPASTHAGDICYNFLWTNKERNDISPTCLSACGDKNVKHWPNGVSLSRHVHVSHMHDRVGQTAR